MERRSGRNAGTLGLQPGFGAIRIHRPYAARLPLRPMEQSRFRRSVSLLEGLRIRAVATEYLLDIVFHLLWNGGPGQLAIPADGAHDRPAPQAGRVQAQHSDQI